MKTNIISTLFFSILFLILILGLLCGCKKDSAIFQVHNLNNNHVSAFGHGGMGELNLLPEDSKESILKVFDVNGEGTDIDIQMSSDSVLIAYHSINLSDATTGSGLVIDNDAGYISSQHFKGVDKKRVRIVEDILNQVPDNKIISFDLKVVMGSMSPVVYYPKYFRAIQYMIDNYHPNSIIECGDTILIKYIRSLRPDYRVFYYPDHDNFDLGYTFSIANGCYGITISNNHVSASQVNQAHAANLWMLLYETKNHKQNLEAYMKSADIIETDHLRDLVDITQ